MNIDDLLKGLGPGGAPPLALFIFALVKRWVVLGWQYDMVVEERDELKQQLRATQKTASAIADVAKKATE